MANIIMCYNIKSRPPHHSIVKQAIDLFHHKLEDHSDTYVNEMESSDYEENSETVLIKRR
uniref:Uncharacterized protein n=1 Tax=Arion vulgaris TaxID=1028688 RepID=A0A0B7BEF7_9EUPU